MDDTVEAREYLRDVRIAAVDALADRMARDAELDSFVRWSFPDEEYESYEDWIEAQRTDDSGSAVSTLWHGGGQWVLYALGLLHDLRIVVHQIDRDTLAAQPGDGTEVCRGDGAEVHLASLRNDDGTPDHFDMLVRGPQPGAEPLRPQPSASSSARRVSLLVGWAALNVLAVAVVLGCGPHLSRLLAAQPSHGWAGADEQLRFLDQVVPLAAPAIDFAVAPISLVAH